MSYCNCWDYLLLHEDWGECSEDRAGAGWNILTEKKFSLRNVPGVLKRKKKKKKFSLLKFFFQKCSWGSETHAKKKLFFGGGGGGVWGARGRKTIHFFL